MLEKLPSWGMIVDGVFYPLRQEERHTYAKGGFYLPTPTARNPPDCAAERKRNSPSLNCVLNIKAGTFGLKTNPRFLEWMMDFPIDWTDLKL